MQKVLPEIEVMIQLGKSQREIAEYFGFKDKYVVKELLKRERRKQRKQAVIYRHREEYAVITKRNFYEVSRSGYYGFVHRLAKLEKDAELTEQSRMCYTYP